MVVARSLICPTSVIRAGPFHRERPETSRLSEYTLPMPTTLVLRRPGRTTTRGIGRSSTGLRRLGRWPHRQLPSPPPGRQTGERATLRLWCLSISRQPRENVMSPDFDAIMASLCALSRRFAASRRSYASPSGVQLSIIRWAGVLWVADKFLGRGARPARGSVL